MKVDDAIETLTRFFNDLIGSLVPGAVLITGLAFMHLEGSNLSAAEKLLGSTPIALTVVGLMYAIGHLLLAIFDFAIQPILQFFKLIKRFDETAAKGRQSYGFFSDFISKARKKQKLSPPVAWGYHDLRSVALSMAPEGASLGRRFMFISLLCNGTGTALLILSIDFMACLMINPLLLATAIQSIHWFAQLALILVAAWSLFRRAESFYSRAMSTPFSIAVAEIILRQNTNAPK